MPRPRKTAATAAAAPFTWRANLACVATYNVLEHDDKMDQFEDRDVPFAAAGGLTMGQLRYWPGVSVPPGALNSIALLKAREFLVSMQKNFTPNKQDASLSSAAVLRATAKVFATKGATLTVLAELVDASFRLPDEQ
jgi:hypothetical protein